MIYAKTVCNKPGSYVEIVPVGLMARLQYSAKGLLEAIQLLDEDWTNVDSDLFQKMCVKVPSKITVKDGTTWVEGVFYFDDVPFDGGDLLIAMKDTFVNRIKEGEIKYTFYAGFAESMAVSFGSSLAIRNWLSFNKFLLLPGTVVPQDISEATLQLLMSTGNYTFKYPFIAGFYTFDNDSCEFVTSGLSQATIANVEQEVSEEGYIYGVVTTDEGTTRLNYSDIVTFNLQKDISIVYYEADGYFQILNTRVRKGLIEPLPKMFTCPTCHKTFEVPATGLVECDDPHCLSRSYLDSKRMLEALNAPSVPYSRYKEAIANKEILTSTDVLLLPEIKGMKLTGTLAEVLRAAIPFDVCPDSSFIDKFVRSCNYNVDTLCYYVNNPRHIITELDGNSFIAKRLVEWLSDPYNASTILTLLDAVTLTESTTIVDAAPIFRGNTFVLTGIFKRGGYEKICSILESYAAKILEDIDHDLPTAVITGSTCESISGHIIQQARKYHVPIIEEDDFFAQNDLDNDLRVQNLL